MSYHYTKFKIKNNEYESTSDFCKFYGHVSAEYDKEEFDMITYQLVVHEGDVVAYIDIRSEDPDAVEFINKIEKGLKRFARRLEYEEIAV